MLLALGDGSNLHSQGTDVSFIPDVEVVAGHYGVSTADMLSASRDEKIATARLVALYLTHRGTTASLPEIAYAFNRSHVAVLHAVGVVSQRIERDAMFRFEVEQLLRQSESKCS